jgi:hypothetical protein
MSTVWTVSQSDKKVEGVTSLGAGGLGIVAECEPTVSARCVIFLSSSYLHRTSILPTRATQPSGFGASGL